MLVGFALASPFDFSFDFSEALDLSDCEDVACGVLDSFGAVAAELPAAAESPAAGAESVAAGAG